MKELKRFEDLVSGLSWLFIAVFIVLYPLIFGFTWKELVVAYVIDAVAFGLTKTWNIRSLQAKRPYLKSYFSGLNEDFFGGLNTAQRVTWIEELTSFPSVWARRCFFLSFLKSAPAIAWFYWCKTKSPGAHLPLEAMKLLSIALLANTFLASAIFIESHALASRYLKRLHARFALKEVFDSVAIPPPQRDLQFYENLAVSSIWLFMMVLQLLVLKTHDENSAFPLEVVLPLVGLVGLGQSTHIWSLGRRYLVDGLYDIFAALSSFDPKKSPSAGASLALHSSPLLAHFDRVFNSLTDRLRSYERELSNWIFRKAEESRYSALGEISGMVIHDLSAPMHVVHFCAQQLKEEPEKAFDPRYLEQLTTSGERALELINALKSYLRTPDAAANATAVFREANSYVAKMLATQFHARGAGRIRVTVDPALDALSLRVSRPDLIHILLNLQANSYENMLSRQVVAPELSLNLGETRGDEIEILIRDTGTGLSPKAFEEMTSFAFQEADGSRTRGGSMGLKLVRRLIERHEGSLKVLPLPEGQAGTLFSMKLKRARGEAPSVVAVTEETRNGG